MEILLNILAKTSATQTHPLNNLTLLPGTNIAQEDIQKQLGYVEIFKCKTDTEGYNPRQHHQKVKMNY